jgi:hypothetical protein
MFFPSKWNAAGAKRLGRTILVAGLLVSGATPSLLSEGNTDSATAPSSKFKERSVRRAEPRPRKKEKPAEDAEESLDKDLSEKSAPSGKRNRSEPTQVAIKTTDANLKAGAMSPEDLKHPLAPAIQLVSESHSKLASVKDYTGTFLKTEDVNGKIIEQSMALKVRENPFSVALKFNSPYRGRQVIYVEGENDGKMLVKPEGFKAIVGTLSIDPHGDQALAENRHPITQAGLSSMVRLVLSQWKSELKQEDLHDVEITEDKSTGQTCRKIQVVRSSQTPGIPFHMTCLYLSQETKLPVRIENYDWPSTPGKKPVLVEQYTFQDVKTNVGLNDDDFR